MATKYKMAWKKEREKRAKKKAKSRLEMKRISQSRAPSQAAMMDRPPRKVGVEREQAKIEPAGLSAKISAIVNSIISMIVGR